MDLIPRLNLAGQNLLHCLCPAANHLPYWHMAVDEDGMAAYEFRPHCTGHNVGRWWNAMLRLQVATGFAIPAEIERHMLENTWRLSDNPSGILLEDARPDDPSTWYIHSYRETMLAFGLLVKHRGSVAARERGIRVIERMRRASQDLTQGDLAFGSGREEMRVPAMTAYTHGRAIEGLLCFYEAAGVPLALEEAGRLAEFHFRHTVRPDGALAAGAGHHTHSYLNTLRGLLRFATISGYQEELATLLATYKDAVSGMITRSGFVTHDIGSTFGGDIASAGDVAHLAILLWERFRDAQLLDDAERIVRARLLPAQVRELPSITGRGPGGKDRYRDLANRFVGAIGGSVGHVRGQTCVTDFTAASLHSLIEVFDRVVVRDERGTHVHFHFDYRGPTVDVQSVRRGGEAHLSICHRAAEDLFVRIPRWAPRSSLRLLVNDRPAEWIVREGYARVSAGDTPIRVDLHYALPEYETREVWRDEWATQEHVTFHWRGDEIDHVDPVGEYLAPYPKVCHSIQ